MKTKIALALVATLWSCAVVEDERTCIDWKSYTEIVEDCTPIYGNIICVVKEKPRFYCVLYEENE